MRWRWRWCVYCFEFVQYHKKLCSVPCKHEIWDICCFFITISRSVGAWYFQMFCYLLARCVCKQMHHLFCVRVAFMIPLLSTHNICWSKYKWTESRTKMEKKKIWIVCLWLKWWCCKLTTGRARERQRGKNKIFSSVVNQLTLIFSSKENWVGHSMLHAHFVCSVA